MAFDCILYSIGTILSDDDGKLYECDTIWADGELTLVSVEDDTCVRHVSPEDYWPLTKYPF